MKMRNVNMLGLVVIVVVFLVAIGAIIGTISSCRSGSAEHNSKDIEKKLELKSIRDEIYSIQVDIKQVKYGNNAQRMFMAKKLIDMKSLRIEIGDNIVTINEAMANINDITAKTKKIVRDVAKDNDIDSFEKAVVTKRINDNLLLIQRTTAIIKKMKALEQQYWAGFHDLKCKEDNVRVNIIVDEALGNERAGEIINMIDNVLEINNPLRSKFEIRDKDLSYDPLETIWKSIMKN